MEKGIREERERGADGEDGAGRGGVRGDERRDL